VTSKAFKQAEQAELHASDVS